MSRLAQVILDDIDSVVSEPMSAWTASRVRALTMEAGGRVAEIAREMLAEEKRADTAEARVADLESFLARTAHGGSIVSSAALTYEQLSVARAADRMMVTSAGLGFVYVAGPVATAEEDR